MLYAFARNGGYLFRSFLQNLVRIKIISCNCNRGLTLMRIKAGVVVRPWTVDAVALALRPAEMVRDGNQSTSTEAFAKHGTVAKGPLGALEPLGLAYPNISLVPPRPFYIQSLHTQPCGLIFSLKAKPCGTKQHWPFSGP